MNNQFKTFSLLICFISSTIFLTGQSTSIDSFEIHMKDIERSYEIDYMEFENRLIHLSKYGDIHNYVLDRLGESRRTAGMHDYYPAFLSFVCRNMGSVYREGIIEQITQDSITRTLAYPLVQSCLYKDSIKTCELLDSFDLEKLYIETESLLYESLIELKDEMGCGK